MFENTFFRDEEIIELSEMVGVYIIKCDEETGTEIKTDFYQEFPELFNQDKEKNI